MRAGWFGVGLVFSPAPGRQPLPAPPGWLRGPPAPQPRSRHCSAQLSRALKKGKNLNFLSEKRVLLLETARFAGEPRVVESDSPLQNPSPKSRPIPHHSAPFSVCLFPRSLFHVCGTNPLGIPAPELQHLAPRISTSCTYPRHAHFLPCPAIPPRFSPRFLHPSLISLANLNPFPSAARICFNFLVFFFLKERGIFQAPCTQHPISPCPSCPVFRLAGWDP